jgi:fermentation-respiration switch protein FrsA (DUF1100 family)
MLKVVLPLALLCLGFYVALCAYIFVVQRKIEYGPDTSRPDLASVGIPALREVHLRTATGLDLLAWYLPAAGDKPVLAYFHGNGGNLQNRARRFQRAAAAGWGLLMVEYPGFGGNPGRPSEQGFDAAALAAMAFLGSQRIEPGRTVIFGESIGTAVATRLAAGRDIAALVLEAPFTSALAIAERRFPYLPVRLLMLDRFDQAACIGRVKAPILILQGSLDPVVPPDLGVALYDAAPSPKRLWVAPEGEHENLMELGGWERVMDFVDHAVSKAPIDPPAAIEVAAER